MRDSGDDASLYVAPGECVLWYDVSQLARHLRHESAIFVDEPETPGARIDRFVRKPVEHVEYGEPPAAPLRQDERLLQCRNRRRREVRGTEDLAKRYICSRIRAVMVIRHGERGQAARRANSLAKTPARQSLLAWRSCFSTTRRSGDLWRA